MKSRNIQFRLNNGPAGKNGFAGREVLAEIFNRRAHDREEIAAEFSALSGSGGPVSLSGDARSIERSLKRSLGVPVTVVDLPEPSISAQELERLSAELRRIDEDKVPGSRAEPSNLVRLGAEIAEEFAALSARADIPYSSVATERAERDMSGISGVPMTVRPYSKSKKKDMKDIERE